MKNKLTLVAALLLCMLATNAQTNYLFDPGDSYGNGSQNMIGQREYKWDADTVKWDDVDSFNLQYNGLDQLVLRNTLLPDTTVLGPWKNTQITKLEYDVNGLVTLQVDTAPNPLTGQRYEYTYNSSGREVMKMDKVWNAGVWKNYRRYQTTYTAFDSVNVYLEEGYTINNVWMNGTRLVHLYNTQKLDSVVLYEEWDQVNSVWQGGAKSHYTYDVAGNILVYTREVYDAMASVYKNEAKTEYTYNGSNHVLTATNYDWNVNTNLWRPTFKYGYNYNGQGLKAKEVTEKWNTANLEWDSLNLATYTYDGNNRPIEDMYQTRTSGAWVNQGRQTFTRDANGYRTRFLVEFWNTNTLAWRNHVAIDYWYADKTISAIAPVELNKVVVYPNPVNRDFVFVSTETAQSYQLYDIAGRLLQQGQLQQGENRIQFYNTTKGIRLLRVGNTTTKLITE